MDPDRRLLLRDDHPIPLQPKAFETLLVLVRNSEKVVLKGELLDAVWADTFVEESNLTQNIFVLRKALGDMEGGRRYIITVPGRGYRFAEAVRVIPQIQVSLKVTSLPEVLHPEETHHNGNGILHSPSVFPPVTTQFAQATTASRSSLAIAIALVGVIVLTAGALLYRRSSKIPRLLSVSQVTKSARLDPWGRIFSDGLRLFLLERDGDHWNSMQVSAQGGETQPFLATFHNTRIFAISPKTSEMLVAPFVGRTGNLPLWILPLVGGSPRRLGNIFVDDAEFSPDGTRIAFSRGDGIYLSDTSGSTPQKLAACPALCQSLAWSPDGKVLRFTLVDGNSDQTSLWEVTIQGGSVHPLFPGWHNPHAAQPGQPAQTAQAECCGRWTPDGRYYIFASVGNKESEIWALREFKSLLQFSPSQPIQLTHGPFGFGEPLPSRDGHAIYASGGYDSNTIERIDAIVRQAKPLLNGGNAWEMAISRDGQWAVYIAASDDSVWRSRADGSAPQKLFQNTTSLRFTHARWCPDGKRILLQGAGRGRPPSIYIMSLEGGALTELPALGHPYIIPDLSPDNETIVFGPDAESANKSSEKSVLSLYNLKTGVTTPIPESHGIFGAAWSPDGRYLAALSADFTAMKLYDFERHRWSDLAHGNYFTNPYWSADAKYVYFQDLLAAGEPVFRFPTKTWNKEPVFSFDDLLRSGAHRYLFIGLTPDGSLLTRVNRTGRDLYALDVDLP